MAVNSKLINEDKDWVRRAFYSQLPINTGKISGEVETDMLNRFWSTARMKIYDTLPGGSLAINPAPQYTRFADIRPPNIMNAFKNTTDAGLSDGNGRGQGTMGRFYSETIDDNQQVIHMRFGVPKFNSLVNFFSNSYSYYASTLAKTGRAPGMFYSMGKVVGFVISLNMLPLVAINYLGKAINFLNGRPTSKFVFLSPTMPTYWSTVQAIVNQIAVNMNLVPRIVDNQVDKSDQTQGPIQESYYAETSADSGEFNKFLHELYPEIFLPSGTINVASIASRANRRNHYQNEKLREHFGTIDIDTETGFMEAMKRYVNDLKVIKGKTDNEINFTPEGDMTSFDKYLNTWFATSRGGMVNKDGEAKDVFEMVSPVVGDGSEQTEPWIMSDYADHLRASFEDGYEFISFRVNPVGTVGESFSSNTEENALASKLNGATSSNRNLRFMFADGNISDDAISQALKSGINAFKDMAGGALDSIGFSGLIAVLGSAYTDIPKQWASSSMSLNRGTYTIDLMPTCGSPIALLVQQIFPLACLLAGALPISHGKQTHGSPFMCEYFHRGHSQSRYGVISSLNVERGTAQTPFKRNGQALGMRVTFTIEELTTVMSLPLNPGMTYKTPFTGATGGLSNLFGAVAGGATYAATLGNGEAAADAATGTTAAAQAAPGVLDGIFNVGSDILGSDMGSVFDEDNLWSDYMGIITGMGLAEQVYAFPKIKRNITRILANWDSKYSRANMAMHMGEASRGGLLGMVYRGNARAFREDF